jgi:hypothetical protein
MNQNVKGAAGSIKSLRRSVPQKWLFGNSIDRKENLKNSPPDFFLVTIQELEENCLGPLENRSRRMLCDKVLESEPGFVL